MSLDEDVDEFDNNELTTVDSKLAVGVAKEEGEGPTDPFSFQTRSSASNLARCFIRISV